MNIHETIIFIIIHMYTCFTHKHVHQHMYNISRVLGQFGVSQACYIVKINHSGREPSIYRHAILLMSLPILVVV